MKAASVGHSSRGLVEHIVHVPVQHGHSGVVYLMCGVGSVCGLCMRVSGRSKSAPRGWAGHSSHHRVVCRSMRSLNGGGSISPRSCACRYWCVSWKYVPNSVDAVAGMWKLLLSVPEAVAAVGWMGW